MPITQGVQTHPKKLTAIHSCRRDRSRLTELLHPTMALANSYSRTPAMASGTSDHIWTVEEIVKLAVK